MDTVPYEQVLRDNPHGTLWQFREGKEVPICPCDGKCDNKGVHKPCTMCGNWYCTYCEGFRFWHRFESVEGYWADYGYKPATDEWYLWAN